METCAPRLARAEVLEFVFLAIACELLGHGYAPSLKTLLRPDRKASHPAIVREIRMLAYAIVPELISSKSKDATLSPGIVLGILF